LGGRFNVATEEDHAARLHFIEQLARAAIKPRSGQSNEEKLSGLIFKRLLVFHASLVSRQSDVSLHCGLVP
jgi:hypothetical protein